MSSESVYFVPKDPERWMGNLDSLAENLWERGLVFETPSGQYLRKAQELRNTGQALPPCSIDFDSGFDSMVLVEHDALLPVPNQVWDVTCPGCSEELLGEVYDLWTDEDLSSVEAPDRVLECPHCGHSSSARDLCYGEPMEFARLYLLVTGCSSEGWDPAFRQLVESITGPCEEYWEVSP